MYSRLKLPFNQNQSIYVRVKVAAQKKRFLYTNITVKFDRYIMYLEEKKFKNNKTHGILDFSSTKDLEFFDY